MHVGHGVQVPDADKWHPSWGNALVLVSGWYSDVYVFCVPTGEALSLFAFKTLYY